MSNQTRTDTLAHIAPSHLAPPPSLPPSPLIPLILLPALLYSVLYEKVFEEPLSQASKTRLARLYDSDFQKLATDEKCDKHLAFLSKTYPVGVLEGMGQNCYSNTPLHVYQRERECEYRSLGVKILVQESRG